MVLRDNRPPDNHHRAVALAGLPPGDAEAQATKPRASDRTLIVGHSHHSSGPVLILSNECSLGPIVELVPALVVQIDVVTEPYDP